MRHTYHNHDTAITCISIRYGELFMWYRTMYHLSYLCDIGLRHLLWKSTQRPWHYHGRQTETWSSCSPYEACRTHCSCCCTQRVLDQRVAESYWHYQHIRSWCDSWCNNESVAVTLGWYFCMEQDIANHYYQYIETTTCHKLRWIMYWNQDILRQYAYSVTCSSERDTRTSCSATVTRDVTLKS